MGSLGWTMKKFVLESIDIPEQSKKVLKRMSEDQLMNIIAELFDISYYEIHQIDAVAWVANADVFYIKFQLITDSYYITRFVELKFDGKNFIQTDNTEVMSAKEGKKKFKQKYPDLNSNNFALCWQ